GLSGIQKLIDSRELGTVELSTGLQISGNFTSCIEHNGHPVYIQTQGGTALAYREKELIGHSTAHHSTGFGTPLGKLKGINIAIENMSPRDLKAYEIYEGKTITLEFEGKITVTGKIITGTRNLQGKIVLVTFEDCTVCHGDTIIFKSDGNLYNMAIGERIASAFHGPADLNSFNLITHEVLEETIRPTTSMGRKKLEELYQQVRDFREGTQTTISRNKVFQEVRDNYPTDWLLPLELYELAETNGDRGFAQEIMDHLESVKLQHPEVGHLIDNGIGLVPSAP
ncbi:MAG: phenylalanine 4-monooxygenase, partial [Flavobacteriaceae bacterium]